jgi:hypothetical protein
MRRSGATRLIKEILDEGEFFFRDGGAIEMQRCAQVEDGIKVIEMKNYRFVKKDAKFVAYGKSSFYVKYLKRTTLKHGVMWKTSDGFDSLAKAMDFYARHALEATQAYVVWGDKLP